MCAHVQNECDKGVPVWVRLFYMYVWKWLIAGVRVACVSRLVACTCGQVVRVSSRVVAAERMDGA